MNIGKAIAIFLQIDSNKFSDEEKAEAIFLVMNMATHNSIKKDNMLAALKWLWHQKYEWIEEDKQTNFDRIRTMSIEEMADMFQKNIHTCDFCIKKDAAECVDEHCKDNIKKWLESEVSE